MNNTAKTRELRHYLTRYGLPPDRPPIPLGHPQVDSVLGADLRRMADEPLPGPSSGHRHPRNMRVLPPSRDFH